MSSSKVTGNVLATDSHSPPATHYHHHHHHSNEPTIPTTGPMAKWWRALQRLVLVQLICSSLMQVSYVAFPAYNFTLALWCFVCASSAKWFTKNPPLVLLIVGAFVLSIVTDITWMSLWVSGNVFYDQFCGQNGVSIVSCGGASDYFPGCVTNRFALFTLLLNDVVKVGTIVCALRVHRSTASHKKSIQSQQHQPQPSFEAHDQANPESPGNTRASVQEVHT